MLEAIDLEVAYGAVQAVRGVSLTVEEGEIVALIGANGAGKSSILAALSGTVKPVAGYVLLDGEDITSLPPHRRVEKGLCLLPEGGGIFREQTVANNLALGAYLLRDRDQKAERRAKVYEYFPVLQERERQRAGTLSGGERQMLAIGKALMMQPKVLMMDEPSLGLAPMLVQEVFDIIKLINREEDTTILLVEQNSTMALSIAHRAYVMEVGRIVKEGPAAELAADSVVREAYLGRIEVKSNATGGRRRWTRCK